MHLATVSASLLLFVLSAVRSCPQDPHGSANITRHLLPGRQLNMDDVKYHGGRIITSDAQIHIIYYGKKWPDRRKAAIESFLNNISKHRWYRPTLHYGNGRGQYPSDNLSVGTTYHIDNYRYTPNVVDGKHRLPDYVIRDIISDAIHDKHLPYGSDDMYYVLSDSAVIGVDAFDQFGVGYCGYHSYVRRSGKIGEILYAYAGDVLALDENQRYMCEMPYDDVNVPGLNAMMSVIAHELTEMVTDPLFTAWYDNSDNELENADKCIFDAGETKTVNKNGKLGVYNVNIAGEHYVIQQIWDRRKQKCAESNFRRFPKKPNSNKGYKKPNYDNKGKKGNKKKGKKGKKGNKGNKGKKGGNSGKHKKGNGNN